MNLDYETSQVVETVRQTFLSLSLAGMGGAIGIAVVATEISQQACPDVSGPFTSPCRITALTVGQQYGRYAAFAAGAAVILTLVVTYMGDRN